MVKALATKESTMMEKSMQAGAAYHHDNSCSLWLICRVMPACRLLLLEHHCLQGAVMY
jgi:hypothetical protein